MVSRDIAVTIGDETIILNFGTNTQCRLEAALGDGRSWGDAIKTLSTVVLPPIALIRQFVQASIVTPANPTLEYAGEFIDNVGGWAMVLQWFKADEKGDEPTLDPPSSTAPVPRAETPEKRSGPRKRRVRG